MVEMLKMDAACLLDACYKTNLLKALSIANRERVCPLGSVESVESLQHRWTAV